MVEIWEIEWNSSMMEHGRDAGTMEYIFAKGGTLRDFNYVLLNQNDDTWEPLIKAVAERDNSHPDIIRKQAPYGVTQDFRAAQPYAGTAVQSPRQARRQYKTQQTMQGLDNYEQNPSARNAMQAGLYGAAAGHAAANTGRALMSGASKAGSGMAAGAQRARQGIAAGAQRAGSGMAAGAGKAKDFMSRKFPGVRQRMGNFVQGVGDTARHGMDALLGEKDEKGKRVGDGVLARTVKRRGDQNQLDRLQTQSYFDQPSNEEEKAKLQADIDEAGPSSGFSGLRNEIRRLGDARRGARTVDPAVAAAGELAEEQMEDGPVDSALTDQPPIEENPLIEEDPMPSTQLPPPEAGQPQKVPDPAEEFARTQSEKIFQPGSSRRKGYDRLLEGARNKPESYEANAKNFGNRGFSSQLASAVAEYHGLTPAQAEEVVQSAEEGDPQAKKIVEDAESSNALVEDEPMPNSLMVNDAMALSEDNIDTRGWNLLMKQLAIR